MRVWAVYRFNRVGYECVAAFPDEMSARTHFSKLKADWERRGMAPDTLRGAFFEQEWSAMCDTIVDYHLRHLAEPIRALADSIKHRTAHQKTDSPSAAVEGRA